MNSHIPSCFCTRASLQVAMVGSNALACAMLPMICHNVTLDEQFDKNVMMWMHDANLTHGVSWRSGGVW